MGAPGKDIIDLQAHKDRMANTGNARSPVEPGTEAGATTTSKQRRLALVTALINADDADWTALSDIASFYLGAHWHDESDAEVVAWAEQIAEVMA